MFLGNLEPIIFYFSGPVYLFSELVFSAISIFKPFHDYCLYLLLFFVNFVNRHIDYSWDFPKYFD